MPKRLSEREMLRDMTRLELRQADEIKTDVQHYMHGHKADEVAQRIGMPKTLVCKLNTDNAGYLYDCVLWMRRQEKDS